MREQQHAEMAPCVGRAGRGSDGGARIPDGIYQISVRRKQLYLRRFRHSRGAPDVQAGCGAGHDNAESGKR